MNNMEQNNIISKQSQIDTKLVVRTKSETYLSLSPALQNTDCPSHDIARQKKSGSSKQEKLQKMVS